MLRVAAARGREILQAVIGTALATDAGMPDKTFPSRPFVLLVAIDSSPQTDSVIAYAAALARGRAGAVLHVVHVVAPPGGVSVTPLATAYATTLAGQREFLDGQARAAKAASGVSVVGHFREGDPWRCIVQTGASIDADLVVLGTRDRQGVTRLVLGSVAENGTRFDGRWDLDRTKVGTSFAGQSLAGQSLARQALTWQAVERRTVGAFGNPFGGPVGGSVGLAFNRAIFAVTIAVAAFPSAAAAFTVTFPAALRLLGAGHRIGQFALEAFQGGAVFAAVLPRRAVHHQVFVSNKFVAV